MPDTRYLQWKNGRWYFQISVPKDLQPVIGKKVITRYLGTADTRTAQNARWEHVAAWKAAFRKARDGQGLTADEIEEAAQTEYRRLATNMFVEPNVYHFRAAGSAGDPVRLALSESIHDTVADLQDGDYSRVQQQVNDVIRRTGAALDEQGRAELAQALMQSHIAAFSDAISLRQGEEPSPIRTLNTARNSIGRVRTRRGKGMPISQAAKEFVQEKMRDPAEKWTEQTKKQNEAVYRLFVDHVGDCPVDSVTRQDAVKFRATVARLQPNWARSARAKGLPLSELLERYSASPLAQSASPAGEPSLTNKTLDRYTSALVGLFRWLKGRDLYSGDNPFGGLMTRNKKRREGRTKWLPFSDDELKSLFHSPLFLNTSTEQRVKPKTHDVRTALLWAPLISLYSGLRSDEICQLRLSDVRQDNGIWFFNVAEAGDDKQVKTPAGYRRVPVHSMLVRCGFLEYLKHVKGQGHEFLLPGLKPGGPDKKRNWYFTRSFTGYRRGVKVERLDPQTGRNRVSFHSFRKNVGTALERARIPESEAVQVLGHEKLSMSYDIYSLGLDMKGLRRVVEKIKYPGLDLSHLYVAETTSTAKKRMKEVKDI
jgi:integrase